MSDDGTLLGTLAQSSAAIVAIVGGFLVSRLVQLSSERDGLRRQRQLVIDDLAQVTRAYDDAQLARLSNGKTYFLSSVIDELVRADLDSLDRDPLLQREMPLGSSAEEMRPYLDGLVDDVRAAHAHVRRYVTRADGPSLDLEDLRKQGLTPTNDSLYAAAVDAIAEKRVPSGSPWFPAAMVSSPVFTGELRRLEESIRAEQDLHGRKQALASIRDRLSGELAGLGRPAGVTGAIAILAVYSLTGIVAPVLVLAIDPDPLPRWVV